MDSRTNGNLLKIQRNKFAAQWYTNKMALLETEYATMKERFPQAQLRKAENDQLYWHLPFEIKIGAAKEVWEVLLVYDKDHPHNRSWGGSIKVYPITPSFTEMQQQMRAAGRQGSIPHMLRDSYSRPYLCTAKPSDIGSGRVVTTAVTVARWAMRWAYYYEVGLLDIDCWNEFCKH